MGAQLTLWQTRYLKGKLKPMKKLVEDRLGPITADYSTLHTGVLLGELDRPWVTGEGRNKIEHKCVQFDFVSGEVIGHEETLLLRFEHIWQEHFDRNHDAGHADYVSQLLRDDVVVTEDSGGGYIYDKPTTTWVKRPSTFLIAAVVDALKKPVNLLYVMWDKYYPRKAESQIEKDRISRVWQHVNSHSHGKNVFKQAHAKLSERKKEFVQKIDSAADSLPMMGNKVVCMGCDPPVVRDRTKEDYWSVWLPFTFFHQEVYPNAKRFIRSVVIDDKAEAKQDYSMETRLQMMCGYCLTGSTQERKLFNLTGSGRNGKTALCSYLQAILGPFYGVGHSDLFIANSNGRGSCGGPEPHKAMLRGKRLCVLAETGEADKLNMKNIKELVDNNDGCIQARDCYEKGEGSVFKNTAKLMVCSNPPIKFDVVAGDDAPAERLDITHFPIKFDPPGEDLDLENHRPTDTAFVDSLRNEHLSEVASYFIVGASKYLAAGRLPANEKVQAATKKIVALNDTIAGFTANELVLDKNSYVVPAALFKAYADWCYLSNHTALPESTFLNEMARKLNKRRIGATRVTAYIGARLKTAAEKELEEDARDE